MHQSLDELLNDYLSAIRSIQPKGPYNILGWSGGGILGSFLVTRLHQQGEEVDLFGCIDTPDAVFDDTSIADFLYFIKKEMNLTIDFSSTLNLNGNDDEKQILKTVYEQALAARKLPSDMKIADFIRQYEILKNATAMVKQHFDELKIVHAKNICIFNAQTRFSKTLDSHYKGNLFRLDVDAKLSKVQIVENVSLPCDHFEIVNPPHIYEITERLSKYIK